MITTTHQPRSRRLPTSRLQPRGLRNWNTVLSCKLDFFAGRPSYLLTLISSHAQTSALNKPVAADLSQFTEVGTHLDEALLPLILLIGSSPYYQPTVSKSPGQHQIVHTSAQDMLRTSRTPSYSQTLPNSYPSSGFVATTEGRRGAQAGNALAKICEPS